MDAARWKPLGGSILNYGHSLTRHGVNLGEHGMTILWVILAILIFAVAAAAVLVLLGGYNGHAGGTPIHHCHTRAACGPPHRHH